MKAIPLLFVGLAAASAGCSWNNLQTPHPAGLTAISPSETGNRPGGNEPPPPASVADAQPPAAETNRGNRTSSPVATTGTAPASQHVPANEVGPPEGLWRAAYQSHDRRPIHTLQLGDGEQRVFVTGSFQGDDAGSVLLLDAIAARLISDPQPKSSCLLLRTPNPDGLATSRRWNANGVDLNRNFPSLRHIPDTNGSAGAVPASETETRIVLRLLGDFQPQRVIQVRTADIPAAMAYVNQDGESAWGELLDEQNIARGRFEEMAAAGSLEEFSSQRLHAGTMTIVIPAAMVRRPGTVEMLLALCTGHIPSAAPSGGNGGGQPVASSDPARGPASLTGVLEPIGQGSTRGFVELLPPPPDTTESEDRSGFYELPPPKE